MTGAVAAWRDASWVCFRDVVPWVCDSHAASVWVAEFESRYHRRGSGSGNDKTNTAAMTPTTTSKRKKQTPRDSLIHNMTDETVREIARVFVVTDLASHRENVLARFRASMVIVVAAALSTAWLFWCRWLWPSFRGIDGGVDWSNDIGRRKKRFFEDINTRIWPRLLFLSAWLKSLIQPRRPHPHPPPHPLTTHENQTTITAAEKVKTATNKSVPWIKIEHDDTFAEEEESDGDDEDVATAAEAGTTERWGAGESSVPPTTNLRLHSGSRALRAGGGGQGGGGGDGDGDGGGANDVEYDPSCPNPLLFAAQQPLPPSFSDQETVADDYDDLGDDSGSAGSSDADSPPGASPLSLFTFGHNNASGSPLSPSPSQSPSPTLSSPSLSSPSVNLGGSSPLRVTVADMTREIARIRAGDTAAEARMISFQRHHDVRHLVGRRRATTS